MLVAIGAWLLWRPLLARHGRGVALATLVALVFGTVAYALARSPAWEGAAAFALGAAVVRVAGARLPAPRRPWVSWAAAGALAIVILVLRHAGPEAVLDGLFSSWGGLLYWSPILWLAIAGFVLRDRTAGPAGALAPALLVAAALGAATGGPADHGARFAPVLPLLALGLGRALDGIRGLALRHPLVPVAVGVAALAAWNGLLMAQYRDGRIPRDDTVSFPRVARNAAATVASGVGSPTAWPASWIFAARNRVGPDGYDLLGGVDVLRAGTTGMGGTIDVGDPRTDAAVLRDGWSVRHPCGAEICRAVSGTASLWAPMRETRDVYLSVSAAGTGRLTVSVNGVAVLDGALSADLKPLAVRVPGGRLRRGLNVIAFSSTAEALVDRLVFRSAAEGP